MRFRALSAALLLLLAACSGSSADDTTTTTAATTTEATTTTTVVETTTTEAVTTTSEETTTTTEPEETTTTSEGEGDTTTTTGGDTTTTTEASGDTTSTTYPPPPSTTSTTLAPGTIDPNLEPWAGLYKQPAGYPGFLEFRADGVVRAGTSYTSFPFEGTWDYDTAASVITFSNFDVGGTDCGGADGTYLREKARGGGRTLTVMDDPCESRVNFLTLPGSSCQCMTWLRVDDSE